MSGHKNYDTMGVTTLPNDRLLQDLDEAHSCSWVITLSPSAWLSVARAASPDVVGVLFGHSRSSIVASLRFRALQNLESLGYSNPRRMGTISRKRQEDF